MGAAISQHSGQRNTQTGHLGRHALLHKRYLIMRTIGQGGMGAVYQAKDTKRQAICAIKEMSLSMIPPDERTQAIQNFRAEAKMLESLNHPNLPAFSGFFTEEQRYFMVMEYIDGSTLEDLLERNAAPFAERRVLGWARQLCDVLEYLHSQKPPIIFRDMKPGNIMLMRNGRIKLIDFGIARIFHPTNSHDTQLLGTPGFAPPEQYGKAQTDERSDIYSLAITLFQLLTDTLSEVGFGLQDVGPSNPQISPSVVRVLEKAASLAPKDRYENVAAFRRALLGVGTFAFENGEAATTPRELANLCARYPDEASGYLAAGEIESWLREIGELNLARAVRQIRSVVENQEAVERFLQMVLGPNAHIPGRANGVKSTPSRNPRFSRASARSPVQVEPCTLDFGQVYSGISAPMTFTVAGNQGLHVKGVICPTESWIIVDQTQFDGMSTSVKVRINSTHLRGTHYTGTILVSPDSKDLEARDIVVTVEADVLNFSGPSNRRNLADLDEEEDDLTMGTLSVVTPTVKVMAGQTQIGVPAAARVRDSEYKQKYGSPNQDSVGWDPLQATPQQRLWMQRSFTCITAFMGASLLYTILSHIPLLARGHLLPPNPWFILVLSGIVPAASLGALVANGNGSWTLRDVINRACTGMFTTLLSLTLVETIWQFVVQHPLPSLQLFVMLLVASLAAAFGTHPIVSKYVLDGVAWPLKYLRGFFSTLAGMTGGVLGFFLTAGFPLNWYTPLGVVLGIGVAIALVSRADHLLQRRGKQRP